jgi:hypothetical protein
MARTANGRSGSALTRVRSPVGTARVTHQGRFLVLTLCILHAPHFAAGEQQQGRGSGQDKP